jgi:hypothetical protein
MRGRPKQPRPGDSAQWGKRGVWPAATRARHAIAVWSPRAVCACGDALTSSSAVARRWQGVTNEHRWGPAEAPGKKSGDGAHQDGRATVGRREAVGAAVFNGGGVAPVVIDMRGGVLQLEGDPGVRRRRSIEGKSSSEGRSPKGGGRRRSGRGSNGEGGGA